MSGIIAAACCCGQGPAQYRTDCPTVPLETFQRLQVSVRARPIAMCPVQSMTSTTWQVCADGTRPIICYPAGGGSPIVGGTSGRSKPTWNIGLNPATAAFANFTNFAGSGCGDYRDLSYSFVDSIGSPLSCDIDEQIDCGLPNTYTCTAGDCISGLGSCLTVTVRNWCCDYASCNSPYVMSYLDIETSVVWRYTKNVCGLVSCTVGNCCTDPNGAAESGTWGDTDFIHTQSAVFRLFRLIPITQNVAKMAPGAYSTMESANTSNDWGQLIYPAGVGLYVPTNEYENPCYDGSAGYSTRIDCGDVGELSQFGFDITATIT